MRRSFFSIGFVLLLTSPLSAADKVAADTRRQSDLAYGQILADAAKAGRFYSREQAASGARRHYTEFVARQFKPAGELTGLMPEVISGQ